MAICLIINPGSSSKKYALYRNNEKLLSAKFEKTAAGFEQCVRIGSEEQPARSTDATTFSSALQHTLAAITEAQCLASTESIEHISIRIVAPGDYFTTHRVVDDTFLRELEGAAAYAPLHIPAIFTEIRSIQQTFPDTPLLGISDSAFHTTIPTHAREYSLKVAREHGIKRFGYHGLSVASVLRSSAHVLTEPAENIVVTHVGSGVSVSAVQAGKSVFTTMGFTPASGLMMSSRAGDMDPGALAAVLDLQNLSGSDAQAYLQREGGFNGWLGTPDLRHVLERLTHEDEAAIVAYEAFIAHIQQAIASAVVRLGKIDALILTATVMERNPDVRADILTNLTCFGCKLDPEKNESLLKQRGLISANDSLPVALIPTDEMGEMAHICHAAS